MNVVARPLRRFHGFTLIELAVALGIMGLLAWSLGSGYLNLDEMQARQNGERTAERVRQAVRGFALANARLPRPDINGDGREAADADNMRATGWVPYETLGMSVPRRELAARYGVYRNPDHENDADLAVAVDRGGRDGADEADLVRGLMRGADAPLSPDRIYITGDAGRSGPIDCTDNRLRHVAYFVVVPLSDRNGDGSRFDPPHLDPSQSGNCVYAPSTSASTGRDDIVIVDEFTALAGWLRAG